MLLAFATGITTKENPHIIVDILCYQSNEAVGFCWLPDIFLTQNILGYSTNLTYP